MPELPDVETYRRYLTRHGLHKRIESVGVGESRILDGVSGAELERALRGRSFEQAVRHGKHLLAALDDGGWVAFHFGMTGRFAHFADGEEDPKHDRVRIDFEGGDHLAFVNQRLLGRVGLADDADEFVRGKKLGPDALAVDERRFRERLRAKRGAVKPALMDQALFAGIGNVYSDEILYHARIHPKTSIQALDDAAVERLFRQTRRVLKTAIERGAGNEDIERRVPRTWLLPRRRRGAECGRCGSAVATLKVKGRTAYYCPGCQPAPK